MALAFDVATFNSGAGDRSFTHTPSGTPRAVAVVIAAADNTLGGQAVNDTVDGVTYGGVALTRVLRAVDPSTTEGGSAYLYFLGESVPTGARTVVVDDDATMANVTYGVWVLTFTAASDVAVAATKITEGDVANPSATIPTLAGYSGIVVAGLYSGINDPDEIAIGAGYTRLAGSQATGQDFGVMSAVCVHGAKSGANVVADFTALSNDVALVAAALAESSAQTPPYANVTIS